MTRLAHMSREVSFPLKMPTFAESEMPLLFATIADGQGGPTCIGELSATRSTNCS
jgi:hypothetical protein